jgi:predicted permease
MIQRIQTIWLFLATVAFLSLFLFPYVQILNDNGAAKVLKVSGVYENVDNQVVRTEEFLGLTIATVVIGLLPFVVIWSYRNRKKQLALCYLTIAAILGYSFWLVYVTKGVIGNFQLQPQNYGIGVLLPSIAILFLVLGIKGIRRDERLVKSTERLRG